MRPMRAATAALVAVAALGACQVASATTYYVDGVQTPEDTALQAKGGCAAVRTDGPVPCFSSDAAHSAAERQAIAKGQTPPGWGAPASPALASKILSDPSATSARGPVAHKSDDCSFTDTHVWKDLNRGGIQGWFGGYVTWNWHSEPFYRQITSYVNSYYWYTYWRDSDTTLGGGALYDASYLCREVSSLANGSWNDRFTQFRQQ